MPRVIVSFPKTERLKDEQFDQCMPSSAGLRRLHQPTEKVCRFLMHGLREEQPGQRNVLSSDE